MSRYRRRKANATGRNDQPDQYVNIGYLFLRSEAWRSLSGPAAKLWLEIRSRFNGGNNGKIALSLDEAARLLHLGKATVQRAFQELEAKGFIVMIRKGQWYGRLATLWRITDKPCAGNPATNDWKQWRPTQKIEIGSNTDPWATATGPPQNRSAKIWTATEPVRATLGAAIGSNTDR
jgi:biotin operon repressor